MTRMRPTSSIAALAVFFISAVAHAQQPPPPQPLCIPGTTLCLGANGNGGLGGGAHGQIGPNGASGGANGNGNANGGGYVQPPPPRPPPQYPPPQPQPQPAPKPPPASPPPTPTTPPQPTQPSTDTSYGGMQSNGSDTTRPGIGVYPVVRVGTESGFHFGGDFAFGVHGANWGFEQELMCLYGGTVKLVDFSIVIDSAPATIQPFIRGFIFDSDPRCDSASGAPMIRRADKFFIWACRRALVTKSP